MKRSIAAIARSHAGPPVIATATTRAVGHSSHPQMAKVRLMTIPNKLKCTLIGRGEPVSVRSSSNALSVCNSAYPH